ncbi:MAG: formyltetrahydrofolate deformylase [Orrella sp.]|jgi:formyltetrahydrofolate deformylase|uniref:formyltetrahydrofolate deformylase n=2 Tax=Orrella sp. TaxID=1921583 RepID=UPI003BE9BEC1
MTEHDFILTLACPDRRGIVHHVSGLLLAHDGNILDAQQFGDEQTGQFFLRVHFALAAPVQIEAVQKDLRDCESALKMQWQVHDSRKKARLLIMVSKQGHCLNDLLFRIQRSQFPAEIAAVVSNHQDFEGLVTSYGVPFHHLPITPDTKTAQESRLLAVIAAEQIDLVILARYMQVLSPDLCRALSGRAINIHHSFLPSFKGARPYHQAHARGVKIIGATAHYVTEDLDEGPIIEQDIERVDHAMSIEDFTQVGSDMESLVLSRAVRSHVEHRILLNGKRTVVFR